jgi:hypothetical protein
MKKPTLAQAILMLIIAIIVTVAFVSCHKEDVEWNTFEYTVSPGETMWEIAEEYCPEGMDKREYIYKVEKINNINAGDLSVGQTVTLLTTERG